ncbi:MAG: alpha/beta fold hydrolase [Saprospirales bacterium]|nr:alpha/beta fold hydrolase [Saprospirales bacterium]
MNCFIHSPGKYGFALFVLAACLPIPAQAINPMREYRMRPEHFNLAYEEVKVNTPDGYALNVWIMEPAGGNTRGFSFIIAGSDAGNMGFSLPYAFHLLNQGFGVITFDYRGFGESSDFAYNPDNLYHAEYIADFVAVCKWVKAEKQPGKIGVLAFSMGTLIAAAGYESAGYDLLVGEAVIKSPELVAQRIKLQKGKDLLLPESAKTDGAKLSSIEVPILLFASVSDPITTLEDSQEIAAQRPNRKLLTFEGEHLRGAYTMGIERYVVEIVDFL